MSEKPPSIPTVSVKYAGDGRSTLPNNMGMRAMQERLSQLRGEQYLLNQIATGLRQESGADVCGHRRAGK